MRAEGQLLDLSCEKCGAIRYIWHYLPWDVALAEHRRGRPLISAWGGEGQHRAVGGGRRKALSRADGYFEKRALQVHGEIVLEHLFTSGGG